MPQQNRASDRSKATSSLDRLFFVQKIHLNKDVFLAFWRVDIQ